MEQNLLDFCRAIKISENTWLNVERGTRCSSYTGLDEPLKAEGQRDNSFLYYYFIDRLFAAPLLSLGLVDCQSTWVAAATIDWGKGEELDSRQNFISQHYGSCRVIYQSTGQIGFVLQLLKTHMHRSFCVLIQWKESEQNVYGIS